jgi:hypothetical protein
MYRLGLVSDSSDFGQNKQLVNQVNNRAIELFREKSLTKEGIWAAE